MSDEHAAEIEAAVRSARDARLNAYAPYSGFRVGAGLEATDGRVFTGANVENASFPAGLCAEQVALGTAVSAGARGFERIAIITDAERPAFPCGICRQMLYEFSPDMTVIVENLQGERFVAQLRELLPNGFGPGDWEPRPATAGT